MNSRRHKMLRSSAMLLIALCAAPAFAADEDAAAAPAGEILVTAQKRTENVQDVAGSITAVSGSQIERYNLDTTIDVVKFAPNANAWGSDSRSRPRYYIRGIGNGNQSSNAAGAVSVAADDVYLNSLALQGFPMFDLERVEILNGPQGTLQGKNATAGSINFISTKPSFTPSGYLKVAMGDYGQKQIEGASNGTIVDDMIAVRASARYEKFGGTATNPVSGEKGGDYSDFAARLQLLAQLPSGEILLNLHYRHLDGTRVPYYGSAQSTTVPLIVGDRKDLNLNLDNIDDGESSGGFVRVNLDLPHDFSFTSISAYDQAKRTVTQDVDNTAAEGSRYYDVTKPEQFSQEFRIASPDDLPLSGMIGAYYLHEKSSTFFSFATLSLPGVATPSYYYTAFTQKNDSLAGFANLKLKLLDGLDVQGGLRWTSDRAHIDLISQRAAPPVTFLNTDNWWLPTSTGQVLLDTAAQDQTKKWHKLNYDVAVHWKPTDSIMLYGRIATGYRSGNFQGQVSVTTPPGVVNPEMLTSYEIGAKTSWLEDRVVLNLTAFESRYHNIQISVLQGTPNGNVSALANAAGGYAKGFEAELRARPIEGLSITGNLGLLDTKFTSTTALGGSVANNRFARAPKTTAFLAADYTIPIGDTEFIIGGDGRYNSAYFFQATNQVSPALRQPGYFIGNVRASLRLPEKNIEITATINNVTNKTYANQVLPFSYGVYGYSLGLPRTFLISLQKDF